MGFDELISELRDLPPADLEKVIDFVGHLRKRQATGEDARYTGNGEAVLDQIASDPALKAQFNAMLDRAMAASEQSKARPADEVFAEIRARSRKLRGLE